MALFIWMRKSAVDPDLPLIINPGHPEDDYPLRLDYSLKDRLAAILRIFVQNRPDRFHNLTDGLLKFPLMRVPVGYKLDAAHTISPLDVPDSKKRSLTYVPQTASQFPGGIPCESHPLRSIVIVQHIFHFLGGKRLAIRQGLLVQARRQSVICRLEAFLQIEVAGHRGDIGGNSCQVFFCHRLTCHQAE